MASTICTVKHITLTTIANGSKYQGSIDKEGNELDFVQLKQTDQLPKREYYCHNCKRTFDGTETFDEVKKHFGTHPA